MKLLNWLKESLIWSQRKWPTEFRRHFGTSCN